MRPQGRSTDFFAGFPGLVGQSIEETRRGRRVIREDRFGKRGIAGNLLPQLVIREDSGVLQSFRLLLVEPHLSDRNAHFELMASAVYTTVQLWFG